MTTNMNKYWTRDEDIDADFAAVSDLYDSSIKHQFKPSAQERKARSKPSLFDDSSEEEYFNNGMYKPYGRGAGFLDSDFRLPGVGGVPSFLQQQEEITNDIRETCEVRFSSDDILKSLNQHTKIDTCPRSSVSDKSSNSGYVSSDSPFKECTIYSSNGELHSPLKEYCTSNGELHSPSPKKDSEEKPPPLYEILKAGMNAHKAKMKMNRNNKKKTEKCENLVRNNIFQPVVNKTYDIDSKQDFPELN